MDLKKIVKASISLLMGFGSIVTSPAPVLAEDDEPMLPDLNQDPELKIEIANNPTDGAYAFLDDLPYSGDGITFSLYRVADGNEVKIAESANCQQGAIIFEGLDMSQYYEADIASSGITAENFKEHLGDDAVLGTSYYKLTAVPSSETIEGSYDGDSALVFAPKLDDAAATPQEIKMTYKFKDSAMLSFTTKESEPEPEPAGPVQSDEPDFSITIENKPTDSITVLVDDAAYTGEDITFSLYRIEEGSSSKIAETKKCNEGKVTFEEADFIDGNTYDALFKRDAEISGLNYENFWDKQEGDALTDAVVYKIEAIPSGDLEGSYPVIDAPGLTEVMDWADVLVETENYDSKLIHAYLYFKFADNIEYKFTKAPEIDTKNPLKGRVYFNDEELIEKYSNNFAFVLEEGYMEDDELKFREVQRKVNTGSDFAFDEINFESEGEHIYKVKQVLHERAHGTVEDPDMDYDWTEYLVKYTVAQKGDKFVVTNASITVDGEEKEAIEYRNKSLGPIPAVFKIEGIITQGKQVEEDIASGLKAQLYDGDELIQEVEIVNADSTEHDYRIGSKDGKIATFKNIHYSFEPLQLDDPEKQYKYTVKVIGGDREDVIYNSPETTYYFNIIAKKKFDRIYYDFSAPIEKTNSGGIYENSTLFTQPVNLVIPDDDNPTGNSCLGLHCTYNVLNKKTEEKRTELFQIIPLDAEPLEGIVYLNDKKSSVPFSFELYKNKDLAEEVPSAEDGDGKFEFNSIRFDKKGTYYYSVNMKDDGDANFTYDKDIKTLKYVIAPVQSTEDSLFYLKVDEKASILPVGIDEEAEEGDFKLDFYAKSVDPTPAVLNLQPTLKIEGKLVNDTKFAFALFDKDGNQVGEAVQPDINGKISFPKISYTSEKEEEYTIQQIDMTDETIDYDKSVFKVHVISKLIKDAPKLNKYGIEVTYFKDDKPIESAADLIYTNKVKDANPIKVTLSGNVYLDNQTPSTSKKYQFNLLDSNNKVIETVDSASDIFKFSPITYKIPGTYTYIVTQTPGSTPYIKYDTSRMKVEVTVERKGNELIPSFKVNDVATDSISFNNYTIPASAINYVITGIKTLDGKSPTCPAFTFVLSEKIEREVVTYHNNIDGKDYKAFSDDIDPKDSDYTITKKELIEVQKDSSIQEVKNDNSAISFKGVTLNHVGTYTFKISEANKDNDYVDYDSSVYTLTVSVTKNWEKNKYEISGATLKKGDASENRITFANYMKVDKTKANQTNSDTNSTSNNSSANNSSTNNNSSNNKSSNNSSANNNSNNSKKPSDSGANNSVIGYSAAGLITCAAVLYLLLRKKH